MYLPKKSDFFKKVPKKTSFFCQQKKEENFRNISQNMKPTAKKAGKNFVEKGAGEEARRDRIRAAAAHIDQIKLDLEAAKERVRDSEGKIYDLVQTLCDSCSPQWRSLMSKYLEDPQLAVEEKEEVNKSKDLLDNVEAALNCASRRFLTLLTWEEAKRWNCMQNVKPYNAGVERIWPEAWALKKLAAKFPVAVAVEVDDDDDDDVQEVKEETDDEEELQSAIDRYNSTYCPEVEEAEEEKEEQVKRRNLDTSR